MTIPNLIPCRLRGELLVGICVATLANPLAAQSLQSLAGRWKLTTVMSQSSPATAQAGKVGKAVQAARPARAARVARTGAAVQAATGDSTTAPATPAIPQPTIGQSLTVLVHGDTVITVDSTFTGAAGVAVRPDTFVINGVPREHTPAALGAMLARPGAQNPRAAALGTKLTQATQGSRVAQADAEGRGFTATDSVSITTANRSIGANTEVQWSLSEDGKTLTIDTRTTGPQGNSVPMKRIFSRP